MISAAIQKAVRDAISTEAKSDGKWADVAPLVRKDYKSRDAFEAVKAEFFVDVCHKALPPEARTAMKAIIPRKTSKDYKNATPAQRMAFDALQDARTAAKKLCDTWFRRTADEAFGPAKKAEVVVTPHDAVMKATKTAHKVALEVGATSYAEGLAALMAKWDKAARKAAKAARAALNAQAGDADRRPDTGEVTEEEKAARAALDARVIADNQAARLERRKAKAAARTTH